MFNLLAFLIYISRDSYLFAKRMNGRIDATSLRKETNVPDDRFDHKDYSTRIIM